MKKADNGSRIKIKCTGAVDQYEFFKTSNEELLEFKIGDNEVLAGLEKAVIGMKVGQKKSITVSPEDGFGQRQVDLIEKANKKQFPDHISLEVGKKLRLKLDDGRVQTITITEIDGDTVTLDANHPLAGRSLQFDIEVVDIG
jgi:FKBP-type peptidyl-prolyl cis-trans isomerase 2